MNAAHQSNYRDVAPAITSIATTVRETLHRSPIWARIQDGSLPFAGSASYLEQHHEGLRVLYNSLEGCEGYPGIAELRETLRTTSESMGDALDRSHATARWREHHVTMPSMLEFRRRVADMREHADVVSIAAHSVIRLAAVGACPVPHAQGRVHIPTITVVCNEEQEELFAEELSAALILLLSHGSDVCRAYQGQQRDKTCAVTVAMIRSALG